MSKLAKALTAAAGNAGGAGLTVEDVFSTYLYTGNGTSQTITNGIDLDGEGGLVWTKQRNVDPYNHMLVDTEQGLGYWLESNTTDAAGSFQHISVNVDGYNILGGYGGFNQIPYDYASWTFRKAEKFFDVVTWTGDGTGARTISHSLNGTVGALFMKATNAAMQWFSYHNGLTNAQFLELNATTTAVSSANAWNNTTPTSSEFTVGSYGNISGRTYVAYLFASDAGGFGDDESIIKCGSYSGNSSTDGPEINLGFEPQFLLVKAADKAEYWVMADTMRGITGSTTDPWVAPNVSDAEFDDKYFEVKATGFKPVSIDARVNGSGYNYIYIAIRRPMKTPESGTEVFDINTRSGNSTTGTVVNSDVTPDAVLIKSRSDNEHWMFSPRLLSSSSGTASNGLPLNETTGLSATRMYSFTNDSYTLYNSGEVNGSGKTYVDYILSRASGFFDTVTYTGDGSSSLTVPHNLTVVPELILTSIYSTTGRRYVYHKDLGNTSGLWWNDNVSERTGESYWASTTPTASNFYVGASSTTNVSSGKYIAFMFASLDGISKVGSYTGTGGNLDVDCGFSAGARLVFVKRTDSTGDWYVWDSERGIVAGNDPYLLLNSTAAEVTSTDYIDPLNAGFTVTSSAPAALNASGGTYIFLAIA